MVERKQDDLRLVKIGQLLLEKRKLLGKNYSSREKFIYSRSKELFGGKDWISIRHLTNLELGKNLPSINMLITLSYAYEIDPIELFSEILAVYEMEE
ncbi:hypothetical protein [uncultured Megasphaera sp.]|jgi:transcriptional regulator with XRE-family HTH domain|uniref:hypothetical protein n=2 Tax=Megasphaera sp. TaxID=2023260 RepID=UPI002630FB66|nr:hypothetical protein [uncultured Megasphaera sp.]